MKVGIATLENSMEVPQKTKNKATISSRIPRLGIYLDKTIVQEDTCTPMFIAATNLTVNEQMNG